MRIYNDYTRGLQKKGGFTLIEMLVVIAIIGILASVLMPALQSSLSTARSISCQNNLKQLAMAMHAYAYDNNGWGFINDGFYVNRYILGPIYTPRDAYTLLPYLDAQILPLSEAGNIANYDVTPLALCPEGRRDGTDKFTCSTDGNSPNGSYGFNTYVLPSIAQLSDSRARFGKISAVKKPGKRIFCADDEGGNAGSRPGGLWTSGNFGYRHTGNCNIVFVDNHVERIDEGAGLLIGSGSTPCPTGTWHDSVW